MNRVLVVEDEKTALERIVGMKIWERGKFRICATASNGKEAFSKYKEKHPDIILTDIEMPLMNGLDFLAEIRKTDKITPVIILSCYESFAYAKRAIQLGVQDYLLKDFLEEETLYSALLAASQRIKYRKEKSVELRGEIAGIVFDTTLFEFLEANDESVMGYIREHYGLFKNYFLLLIRIDQFNEREINIKNLGNFIVKNLETNFAGLFSYMGNGYYLAFISIDETRDILPLILEFSSDIIKKVRESFGVSLTMALDSFESVEKIKERFAELQNLIRYSVFLGYGKVILPETVESLYFLDPVIIERKIATLRRDVEREDMESFFVHLKQLYERDMAGMLQYNYLEYINSNLLSILINFINRKRINESESFSGDILDLQGLKRVETVKEMHEWFRKKFTEIFKLAREVNEKITSNVTVREILNIIRNEYRNDLSVEGIAKRMKIHKVYLNRLFKRETGMTCYDYIQRFRIDKAKQILITEDLKIAQVAEKSGFRNYDQFCLTFKKLTGDTPTGFRKKNKII